MTTTNPAAPEQQATHVPDGWQLVPIELTPEMFNAGQACGGYADRIYRSMLSASPIAPIADARASDAAADTKGLPRLNRELPEMLSNALQVTRRIRRCEGETAAQVVLEHFATEYAKRALAAQKQPAPVGDGQAAGEPKADGRIAFNLTREQVSALYLTLLRRERPAFGWMEEPLVAIEWALKPAHNAIHDRGFNAMNRQFFGDDRLNLGEAEMPSEVTPLAPPAVAQQGTLTDEQIIQIAIDAGVTSTATNAGRIAFARALLAHNTGADHE